MKVHVACVTHQFGSTFFAGHTAEKVLSQVAEWCKSYWEKSWVDVTTLTSDHEVVEAYFSPQANGDRESVTFGETKLERAERSFS